MATKNYVNDGTASVTAGAKTVTFADVSLALMKSGDQFMQKGASGIIDTLDLDAGTAELVDNWGGTTTSAQPYTVMTIPVGAELANSTRTIMQYLNGPILSIAAMVGDDAPDADSILIWDDITGGWLSASSAEYRATLLSAGDGVTGTGKIVLAEAPTLTDIIKVEKGAPIYMEFFKSDVPDSTVRGFVGMAGSPEMNLSFNMDYADGTHRAYDTAKSAKWVFMQDGAWGMQYAPANADMDGDGDIWYGSGAKFSQYQYDDGRLVLATDQDKCTTSGYYDALLSLPRLSGMPSLSGDTEIVIEGHRQKGTAGTVYLNVYNTGDVLLANGGGNVGIGVTSPASLLDMGKSVNGNTTVSLTNANNGTSAQAYYRLSNGTGVANLIINGASYTTSGLAKQNGFRISTNGTGGIVIDTSGGSYPIRFGQNAADIGGFGSDASWLVGTSTNGGWHSDAKSEVKTSAGFGASAYSTASSGAARLTRIDNTGCNYDVFNFNGSLTGSIAPATSGTTVAYNQSSSRYLKMGAKALVSSAVLDAKMYRGSWISRPDVEWVGGIADEMGYLVPEGFTPSSTPGLAPHQAGYVPDQFDYSKWVPHMIVQDQSAWAQIKALEYRLAAAGIP